MTERWRADEGTGMVGDIVPQWAFDEMQRRYAVRYGEPDGVILTVELAEDLYPKEEFLRDKASRRPDAEQKT